MELPFPQPPLYKMTQSDLQKFIPTLIRHSTGCKRPEYGKEGSRPQWWPKELPWSNPMVQPKSTRSGRQAAEAKKFTDALREAVRSCYTFHGKDYMLRPHTRATKAQAASPPPAAPLLEDATQLPESASAAEPVTSASLPHNDSHNMTGPAEAAQPFREIFICLCEMEFNTKADLLAHQLECERRNDIETANHNRSPPRESYIESRVLCYDAKEPIAISRVKFFEGLGLIRPEKARRLGQKQGKDSKLHVDCEIIEIEDDNDVQIISPPTPKTPKSLISQLSRDLSPTTRPRRYVNYCEERDDDSDNESVDSSDGYRGSHSVPRRNLHILSIDYCSPLGERVKRQLEQSAHDQSARNNLDSDGEETSPRGTDITYEEYCSTPKKSQFTSMVQKLRNRPNVFPVTFKKSKKHCPPGCHQYKFTARQRYEFYLTKESGLDRRSRCLKRTYIKHKCFVHLERLSAETIKKWTARKPRPYPQFMYPNMTMKNTALMSNEEQLQRLIALHNAAQAGRNMVPNNTHQGAILYRPQMFELHNSSTSLTPPTTPEIYQNRTPSVAASNLLRSICQPQGLSPYQPNTFYGNRPSPGFNRQRQGGVNITRPTPPRAVQHDPICIDSDDEEENIPSRDDVVSISSTESESSAGSRKRKRNTHSAQAPPPKRSRPDSSQSTSPMLLFKCHLCAAEITCKDNFAAYIQSHFRQQHKVTNINLIEHTDANGHKVVSIVEEATDSPTPPPPPPPAKPQSQNQPSSRRKLFRNDKPGPLHSKQRPSRRTSDSSSRSGKEVICLD